MFGNNPLPNIAPSLLLVLPPPPHSPPHCHRRRRPSWPPTWAKRGLAHHWHQPRATATSPTPTTATSPRVDARRIRHVTPAAPPLIEGCGQTTSAMSPPSTTATPLPATAVPRHVTDKNARPRTPRHEARGNMEDRWERGQMGARTNRSEDEREWGREGRGGSRTNGKPRGQGGGCSRPLPPAASLQKPARRCVGYTPSHLAFQTQAGAALAAPVSFRFKRGQHTLPPFLFVSFRFQQGQHLLPLFLFISNRGSTCCPPFSSFWAGAALAAPVLFLSNRGSAYCSRFFSFPTGAALAAPVSLHFEWGQHLLPPFLLVLNGGGVCPTRCPHFFRFRSGAPCIPHATPLFLSVSTGGSVKLKRGPRFLSFTPQ